MSPKNSIPTQNEEESTSSFTYDDSLLESANIIIEMAEEIQSLKTQIAYKHTQVSDDQRMRANQFIGDLKLRVKTLEAVNHGLQSSLNLKINHPAQLLSQIRYWELRTKNAERGLS